jgi:hypothetical protein
MNAIIRDLVAIPGNKSFRETIEKLIELHTLNRDNHEAEQGNADTDG